MDALLLGPLFWGLSSLVFVVLIVIGAVWAVRGLTRPDTPDEVGTTRLPGLEAAQAELRRRYAAGEISREDYLQGKVDLEQ